MRKLNHLLAFCLFILVTSSSLFAQSLTLVSPNGGESWVKSSKQIISWSSTGSVGDVNIAYSIDGNNWTDIATNEPNDGLMYWEVPDTVISTVQVKIEETDGSPADTSDAVFSIVLHAFETDHVQSGSVCISGIAAADFEGDGSIELFTGEKSSAIVNVWSYDSISGNMQIQTTTPAFPNDIHGIIAGDFEENGFIDVVAAVRSNGVYICTWNDTTKDWRTIQNITNGHSYGHYVTGPFDLNDDGHLDFIANQDKEQWIYYGKGDGTFSADRNPLAADTADPQGASSIYCAGTLRAADIDNDNDLDLVGVWRQGGWSYYPSDRQDFFLRGFINLGDTNNPADGIIDWAIALNDVLGHKTGNKFEGFRLNHVGNCAIGDFNEDGMIDITTTDITNNRHLLCMGQGTGTVEDWVESELDTAYASMFTADINSDGHMDIVSGSYDQWNGMNIYFGNGDGTFTLQKQNYSFSTTFTRGGGVGADFNNDGLVDIASSRYDAGDDGFIVAMQQPLPVYSSNIIYVNDDATGNNTGASWEDALNDLQDALALAEPGDSVWVAEGTYFPTTGNARDVSFDIPDSVKVIGGFAGTENSIEERDWQAHLCILNGDLGNLTDPSDNSYHVVTFNEVSDQTLLDGFLVMNGNTGAYTMGQAFADSIAGGGILNAVYTPNESSNPVIKNCTVSRCMGFLGGGFCNYIGNGTTNPTIENCTFYQNLAAYGGGACNFSFENGIAEGLFDSCTFDDNFAQGGGGFANMIVGGEGNPYFASCTFSNNEADTTAGGEGGGLFNLSTLSFDKMQYGATNPELFNCTFINNLSNGGGGMISSCDEMCYDSVVVKSCTFESNRSVGEGGGLYISADSLSYTKFMIMNSTFKHDTASATVDYPAGGGMKIYLDTNAVIAGNIYGCTFDSNYTSDEGGGLSISSDYLTGEMLDIVVDSCTFSNNYSEMHAGAIGMYRASFEIVECTMNNNTAESSGGAIFINDGCPAIRGCDIYDNTAMLFGGAISQHIMDVPNNTIIANNHIYNNTAMNNGGGIHNYIENVACNAVIEKNEIYNNTASIEGGGIRNEVLSGGSCDIEIINCAFYGDSASTGGAISNYGANTGVCNPAIINCSMSGNYAASVGGAIANNNLSGTVSPQIINSVIWGNSTNGGQIANNTATPVFSYSNIEGSGGSQSWNTSYGTDNGNNIDVDPMFVTMPDYNQAPNVTADLKLQEGSPSVNAASPDTTGLALPGYDLGGNPRIMNDTVDMGAYETFIPVGIIYVDASAAGANNGTSWSDAYTNLQDAITDATNGEDIWIAAGTYKPTSSGDRTASFIIPDNVAVYGGFAAGETDPFSRDWEANPTILSGDIGVAGDSTDNTYHIIEGGNYITLDGLIIEKGLANGSLPENIGAGMYNASSVTGIVIRNCVFRHNVAESQGGAIFNDSGVSNIRALHCKFYKNSANSNGAVKNESVEMHFNYCTFIENKDRDINNSRGAAIMYWGDFGNPVIQNCTFYKNSTGTDEGVVHFRSGDAVHAEIINCLFKDNTPMDVDQNFAATFNVSYSRTTQFAGSNNNIADDPLIVDSTGGQFTLLDCSPMIDSTRANMGDFHRIVPDTVAPVITCPGNQTVDADASNTYTVSGTEFDPVTAYDVCGYSLSNDFNGAATLDGAALPKGLNNIKWYITDNNGNQDSCSLTVDVSEFVGARLITSNKVVIHPNPTDGMVQIQGLNAASAVISVIDITGNTIINQSTSEEETSIDLSGQPAGIYFLQIKGDDVLIRKIIKK
jgi:hypothetical protein